MTGRRRFAIVAALVGWLLITSTTGCATMGQKQQLRKKDGPQTVGEFLALPRVQP